MASAASIAMEHDLEGSAQNLPGAQRRRGPRKTAEEMTALAMQVRLLRPAKPSLTKYGLSQPSPLHQLGRYFIEYSSWRLGLSLCAEPQTGMSASKLPGIIWASPDTVCQAGQAALCGASQGPLRMLFSPTGLSSPDACVQAIERIRGQRAREDADLRDNDAASGGETML